MVTKTILKISWERYRSDMADFFKLLVKKQKSLLSELLNNQITKI